MIPCVDNFGTFVTQFLLTMLRTETKQYTEQFLERVHTDFPHEMQGMFCANW